MDPRVGLGLERVVALAVLALAAEALVQRAQPPPGGDRVLAAVDEQRDPIQGAHQPVPRALLEVRVVTHAGADGWVGDLEEQRVEHHRVEADVARHGPRHGVGADEDLRQFVVAGKR